MKSSLGQEFALHLPKGNRPWLEGWYVRTQTKEISFAIIFGSQISNAKKSVFIQFFDMYMKKSRYVEYPWKVVTIQQHPLVPNIRGNRLSMNSIALRLPQLQADLLHSSLAPLHTPPYAPTIMDPFSYVPMGCVHSIISLRYTVSGITRLNNRCFQIYGSSYMEKDCGTSFPSVYA